MRPVMVYMVECWAVEPTRKQEELWRWEYYVEGVFTVIQDKSRNTNHYRESWGGSYCRKNYKS